jgi:hypothetical protein
MFAKEDSLHDGFAFHSPPENGRVGTIENLKDQTRDWNKRKKSNKNKLALYKGESKEKFSLQKSFRVNAQKLF